MSEENTETPQIEDPKAVLDALERAKADAKKYREQAAELTGQIAELQSQLGEVTSLREELTTKQNTIRDIQVKQQLRAGGVQNPDRVMKFMDMDKVSLNDENEVEGLDDVLSPVRDEFPELFDAKRRVGGQVDIHAKGKNNVVKSTSELQADRLLGRN